jgi:hypothetical protein
VLSRWDSELNAVAKNGEHEPDHFAADLFVRRSLRKIREALRDLGDNDDRALMKTADAILAKNTPAARNGA